MKAIKVLSNVLEYIADKTNKQIGILTIKQINTMKKVTEVVQEVIEEQVVVSELTFGQKAVGVNFNPSNRSDVDLAKQTMANAIDQMNDLRNSDTVCVGAKRHASTAITMLEDAQMRMVKALTWKD